MARTNVTDVRVIIDTDLTDGIIEAFIGDANLLVTAILGSSDLSSGLLESIEKWLTAHFISMSRDRQSQEEEAKDASIKYTGKTDMGLDATFYGQTALSLDTSGLLKESANTKPVTFFAVESEEDLNYNTRVQ